eukprot:827470-Amorphochlora_amoeboformis.AAC.1
MGKEIVILLLVLYRAVGLNIRDSKGLSWTFKHETASFGKQQPYNITAPLKLASDIIPGSKGCIPYDHHLKAQIKGTILLVEDGSCSDAKKTLNAQLAGAVGIVVGANDNNLKKMSCSEDESYCAELLIPAVYVTGAIAIYSQFADLTRLLLDETVTSIKEATPPLIATLNGDGESSDNKPPHKITFFLVVLLIIPIAWCIMVAITLVFKICSRLASRQIRRQEMRQIPDIPYTLIDGGSASDLEEEKGDKAQCDGDHGDFKISEGAGNGDGGGQQPINDTCVICLEEFKRGERGHANDYAPCGGIPRRHRRSVLPVSFVGSVKWFSLYFLLTSSSQT